MWGRTARARWNDGAAELVKLRQLLLPYLHFYCRLQCQLIPEPESGITNLKWLIPESGNTPFCLSLVMTTLDFIFFLDPNTVVF